MERNYKDKFVIKVNKSDNPEIYKNRIITALFNSGAVQEKVDGICYRNRIKQCTFINEDILQETFYYLSKKSADEIIEMYENNPRRLLGLSIRIACLKGVATNSIDENYPKHSLAKYILFTSNLMQLEYLSPHGEKEHESPFSQEVLDIDDNESLNCLWEDVISKLSPESTEFLELYVDSQNRKGKQSKEYKAKYEFLLLELKNILTELGFKI